MLYRLTVCCGVVYRGAYGECLLDAACYRPCPAHSNDIQTSDCKPTSVSNSKVASVDSGNEESNSVDDLMYADSYSIDAVASEVDVAMDLSVRGAVADVVPRAALPTTMRLLAVNEV
jgi:hypothetical protein